VQNLTDQGRRELTGPGAAFLQEDAEFGRTFWIGLLWTVIGIVTTPIIIGWFILLGISIWIIYRIVKGALALNDGKAPS